MSSGSMFERASSLGGGMVGRGAGLLGGLCRGLHAGEVVGLGHGQPALGHFGLGVALGAVRDRGAMGLVTGGAFKLLVVGPVGVVGAHVGRKLVEVVAGEVVAALVQAQFVGLATRCLGELAGRALDEGEAVVAGDPCGALSWPWARAWVPICCSPGRAFWRRRPP